MDTPEVRETRRPARESGQRGRVVVITGAAAGIGRATALRFAEEGARVAAWDVSDKTASQLESAIKWAGGDCHFQAVDVANAKSVESAAAAVAAKWGRIDVLINNAGIVRDAQLVKWNGGSPASIMSEETWDAVIGVNLKGVFLVTRAVVPYMIKAGGGVILSAASVVGLLGNFGQTNYVASKAGVIGMTRTWARELGKYKIRVNAVAPGFIATDMVRSMPAKVLEAMVARTPLGRAGTPEDVANTYLWNCDFCRRRRGDRHLKTLPHVPERVDNRAGPVYRRWTSPPPKSEAIMDIRTIGVIGAGTMGNGIAHVFAKGGYNVALVDVEQRFLDRGLDIIRKNMEREVSKAKLTTEQCHHRDHRSQATRQLRLHH
jgi:3-oxoacyl-[acyl-carrier protein] reductase